MTINEKVLQKELSLQMSEGKAWIQIVAILFASLFTIMLVALHTEILAPRMIHIFLDYKVGEWIVALSVFLIGYGSGLRSSASKSHSLI